MSNSYNANVFNVPEQQLKKLSFCVTDRQSLELWLSDTFKQTDPVSIGQALYHVLDELMRLSSKDKLRLELLGEIRPRVREVLAQLEKQNALLTIRDQKRSAECIVLCQALQTRLADAYIAAAVSASHGMSRLFAKPTVYLSKAIHIALEEMRALLLRYYQQYQSVPDNTWLRIYQLYKMAVHFSLENQHHPICSAYKHILLWGSANAHQLHSNEMSKIDELFSHWRTRVELDETGFSEYGIFYVLLDSDDPPAAKSVYDKGLYKVDQTLVFSSLIRYLRQPEANTELIELSLPERLLPMFLHIWGGSSDRVFERKSREGDIQIAIGLSASHYFLNRQLSLEQLLIDEQETTSEGLAKADFSAKRSYEDRLDLWDQSSFGAQYRSASQQHDGVIEFDKVKQQDSTPIEKAASYSQDTARLLDMSPSGYKIEYSGDDAHLLSVGNLLAVREKHHQIWDLAIIRWLKQGTSTTMVGLELYPPNISPSAIVHCNKKAEIASNYMPAFLLPIGNVEIEHEGSIIAPVNMFKPKQYFVLVSSSGKILARVNKTLSSNSHFCQFSFTEHEPDKPIEKILKNDESESNPFTTKWELL